MIDDLVLFTCAVERNEFSLQPLANLFRRFPKTAYCHSNDRNSSWHLSLTIFHSLTHTRIIAMAFTRLAICSLMAILLSGCWSSHYADTKDGTLEGKWILKWVGPDKFVYEPHPTNPLRFTRQNGTPIVVGKRMYTDGGSIPYLFRSLEDYSPWKYGTAYIIHDWLYEMQHCKYEGYQSFTNADAAWIMSEVMKALHRRGIVRKSEFDVWTTYLAVKHFGDGLWANGTCETPTEDKLKSMKPIMAEEIDYSIEIDFSR